MKLLFTGHLVTFCLGVRAFGITYDQLDALKLINDARASFGVAPFTWSDVLADGAESWAAYLGGTAGFYHSPLADRPGQGETLMMWRFSQINPLWNDHPVREATLVWLSQVQYYPPGGKVGDPGSEQWNHWSQLMWSESVYIGCGRATGYVDGMYYYYAVCRMYPEGNLVGQSPFGQALQLAHRQDTALGPFTGDGTFFNPALGACGDDDSGKDWSENLVALSHLKMGATSNNNPLCWRTIQATYGGTTVTGIVKDKCMGCRYGDIDMTQKMFTELFGGLERGRVHGVTWQLLE